MGCDCKWQDPRTEDPTSGFYHPDVIDLGSDHLISFYQFGGEPEDAEPAGCHVWHKKDDGFWCIGSIEWRKHPTSTIPSAIWTLNSLDPLDVSPSLLCHCGDHGFIKQGKWQPV